MATDFDRLISHCRTGKFRSDNSKLGSSFLRRVWLRTPSSAAVSRYDRALDSNCYDRPTQFTIAATSDTVLKGETDKKKEGKWLTLPPFTSTVDGSALGKEIARRSSAYIPSTTTALKWVMKCCPRLPRSLVQKLFRLRQVRRESFNISSSNVGVQAQEHRVKRYWKVTAKDSMEFGDRIFLPNTVQELPSEKTECRCNEEEQKFVHSLELYMDSAIIVVYKPPGMPVQGGIVIKRSLDELAGTYLKHDYLESPRLVHEGKKRILQRKYWALVFGSPRRPHGLISMPLGKVVVDNGKSEQITVIDNVQNMPSLHAITEYHVIGSSCNGLL